MHSISRLRRFALLAAALIATTAVQAQPNVVKLVVPFPAGGITDQAARVIGETMARHLAQTVIVENRPGAGGRIAIDLVAKAPADGKTLLFTNTSYTILPVVDPHSNLDPLKTLAP